MRAEPRRLSSLIGHRLPGTGKRMWYDQDFLAQCESLKQNGRVSNFRPGARIARGFADVGYEEFVVLPNGKMMSLFSGAQSELNEEHRGFFFEVPTEAELLAELETRGELIESVKFADQRTWSVKTTNLSAESRGLHRTLLLCLLASYAANTGSQ